MHQLVSYKMLNAVENLSPQKVVAVVCERFQLLVISVGNFGVLDKWLPTRGGRTWRLDYRMNFKQ